MSKNRDYELLEYIIDNLAREDIQEYQMHIASLLKLAKIDSFWDKIDEIRNLLAIHDISVINYGEMIKNKKMREKHICEITNLKGDLTSDKQFLKRWQELKDKVKKLRGDKAKKQEYDQVELDLFVYSKAARTHGISANDLIRFSITDYLINNDIEPHPALAGLFRAIVLYDFSGLNDISSAIMPIGEDYISKKYKISFRADICESAKICIYNDTTFKQVQDALSYDKGLKTAIKLHKKGMPSFAPIARYQPNYYQKLFLENKKRKCGMNVKDIYYNVITKDCNEENMPSAEEDNRRINSYRKLLYRNKNKN